jgi:NAD-dependent SIR2 family protein deacetylase
MASLAPNDRLHDWIVRHRRVFALTGAGCSTASGIPDYRNNDGEWKRKPPVMIQAFRAEDAVYRRYWARAYSGWPRLTAATPNAAHRAFAAWEAAGTLCQLVTQNVDGLHQRAGSRAVLDLHGRIDTVVCLDCGGHVSRADLQELLTLWNPRYAGLAAGAAPDGDALLEGDFSDFRLPSCPSCGGILKPVIVSNGRVIGTWQRKLQKDAVLVSVRPLSKLSAKERDRVAAAAERYAEFLGLPLRLRR